MSTQNELLQEHEKTYHRFIKWAFRSAALVIVVLVFLAIFRT